MIPQLVNGNSVRFAAHIDPPRFPRGYPGDGPLDKTCAFLISISDEGNEDDQRYWLTCLAPSGKLMAGDMCYTLKAAMSLPEQEFDISDLEWTNVSGCTEPGESATVAAWQSSAPGR